MKARKPKFSPYEHLFSSLLYTIAKDPTLIITVSNYIRSSDLDDNSKNDVLDLLAVCLSKLIDIKSDSESDNETINEME